MTISVIKLSFYLAMLPILWGCSKNDDADSGRSGTEKLDVQVISPISSELPLLPQKLTFEWVHPGVPDLSFNLLYSADNGGTWTTQEVGPATTYTPKEGEFAMGHEYQWRIVTLRAKKVARVGSVHTFRTISPFPAGYVEKYIDNGATAKVSVVMLGDAFLSEDLYEGGPWQTVARKYLDFMFSVEPYKNYRKYFNAYIAYTPSLHRGALINAGGWGQPSIGKATRSDVNRREYTDKWCTYFAASIDPYGLNALKDSCYAVAGRIPGVDVQKAMIVLMVNERRFSGMTWPGSGKSAVAMGTMPDDDPGRGTFEMMLHESAHAFGKLGDEYGGYDAPPANLVSQLEGEHAGGRCLNVSSTSDPARVPWKHLLSIERYGAQAFQPIGVYEGGYSCYTGMWRSEMNSCMGAKMYPYFPAIGREMIVKRIMECAGEAYSLDKFLENDVAESYTNISVPSIKYEY